jgi:hypothetical protein
MNERGDHLATFEDNAAMYLRGWRVRCARVP